jgi:hypothetical protein
VLPFEPAARVEVTRQELVVRKPTLCTASQWSSRTREQAFRPMNEGGRLSACQGVNSIALSAP